MSRVVLTLGWEILARRRWLFGFVALYLACIAAAVPLLPAELRYGGLAALLAIPLEAVLPLLIAHLGHGSEGRLESSASAFPARLFTLPVSSPLLALTPLLLGTVILGGGWALFVVGVLWPCGFDWPAAWPGLFLTATHAWLQALCWSPFPTRWLRLPALVGTLVGLVAVVQVLVYLDVTPAAMTAVLAPLLLLAYAVGITGVARGRRGVGADEPPQVDRGTAVRTKVEAVEAFSSPLRAQLWLAWRMHGLQALLGTVSWGAGLLGVAYGLAHVYSLPLWPSGQAERLLHTIGPAWMALLLNYLWVPFFLALLCGGDLGRFSARASAPALPWYVGTRPIRTQELVRYQVLAGTIGILGMWLILIALAAGWAIVTGYSGQMVERLNEMTGSPLRGGLTLAGWLVAGILVSWLWLLRGLWGGFSGRWLLQWGPILLTLMIVGFVAWVIGHWEPAWRPVLTGAVLTGLGLKAAVVVVVVRELLRRRLARASTLGWVVGGWIVLAGTLASAAWALCPAGWLAAGGVVLLLPLGRCLVAPVALWWNRHR